MIRSVRDGGVIDQTMFKTNYNYGFDSLIFSSEYSSILIGYINCIPERLNPQMQLLAYFKKWNTVKAA